MSDRDCFKRLVRNVIEPLCPSVQENLEMAARYAPDFLDACCRLSSAVNEAFNKYYLGALKCSFIVESAVAASLNYIISPLGLGPYVCLSALEGVLVASMAGLRLMTESLVRSVYADIMYKDLKLEDKLKEVERARRHRKKRVGFGDVRREVINRLGLDERVDKALEEIWFETSGLLHFVSHDKERNVKSIPERLEEYASMRLGVPTGMMVPPPTDFLMDADIEELKKLAGLIDRFIFSMETLLQAWSGAVNLERCE